MSAPNAKAEGSKSEAASFSVVFSKRSVPKKMYLGSTAAKNAMGSTTAASFALEKKTEQQRAKEMQPMQKTATKLKSSHSGVCTQKALTTSEQMSASSRNCAMAVTYHDATKTEGRRPMIRIV